MEKTIAVHLEVLKILQSHFGKNTEAKSLEPELVVTLMIKSWKAGWDKHGESVYAYKSGKKALLRN
jgi:hypothetical protein